MIVLRDLDGVKQVAAMASGWEDTMIYEGIWFQVRYVDTLIWYTQQVHVSLMNYGLGSQPHRKLCVYDQATVESTSSNIYGMYG